MNKALVVDFENVQAVDLAKLPADVQVIFVLGAKQTKLPTEFAIQAQPLGARFRYVSIKDMAPNAVDFCIAFYLGELLTQHPSAECVILSKDKKGFDPLVKHLAGERGFRVRRVNTQKEAFPVIVAKTPMRKVQAVNTALDPFQRLLALLGKENALPNKRKGLEGKIKSWFPNSDGERVAFMKRLMDEGHVTEDKGTVVYRVKTGKVE